MGGLLMVLLALATPAKADQLPFWGFVLDGHPIGAARLTDLQNETGLAAGMVVLFLPWPAPGKEALFPEESLEAIRLHDALPCLTWEPMYYHEKGETAVSADEILSGRYDAYLQEFAARARAWGKPFVIRFAHEMNLERYHWGTDRTGYGRPSPELYRQMFRYVVEIFRRRGATNVQWAFCPNAESVPNASGNGSADWNTPEAYYPGDDWVDILGMDGYNWGTTKSAARDGWQSRWRSFREIFEPLYLKLRRLAPDKPVIVFETATVAAGGDRNGWIREAWETAVAWNLQGICWFQANKEEDWRLDRHRDAPGLGIVRRDTAPGPERERETEEKGK